MRSRIVIATTRLIGTRIEHRQPIARIIFLDNFATVSSRMWRATVDVTCPGVHAVISACQRDCAVVRAGKTEHVAETTKRSVLICNAIMGLYLRNFKYIDKVHLGRIDITLDTYETELNVGVRVSI